MEIEFVGAAREVTGSCHILRVAGKTVLLDCGLFQGQRSESHEKNLRLPIAVEEIDAVVLSHAHIDHAGRLPFLVRHGYAGHDLVHTGHARPVRRDARRLGAHPGEGRRVSRAARQAADRAALLACATHADDRAHDRLCRTDRPFDVVPGVRATFVDAGHILGSASVVLDCTEGSTTRRFVFSGDIGRSGLPIIRDPEPPDGADVVVMESTYGNRDSRIH